MEASISFQHLGILRVRLEVTLEHLRALHHDLAAFARGKRRIVDEVPDLDGHARERRTLGSGPDLDGIFGT